MANGQSDEAAGQEQGSNGGNGKGSAVSNATSSTGRMITSGLRVLQVLLAISCIILLGVADSENARANVPVFQFDRSDNSKVPEYSMAVAVVSLVFVSVALVLGVLNKTPSFLSLMDLIIALVSISAGSTLLADYEPIRTSNRFSNNVKEIAALPEGGGACLVILSLVSAFMAASSIGINGGPILPK